MVEEDPGKKNINEEGILHADLELSEIVKVKIDFDVVGHYARPGIFQLHVNSEAQPPVSYGRWKLPG